MAGILDSKSRVFDVILTNEGRRQLGTGQFNAKYFTFSDANVFYEYDRTEGHTNPAVRIALEACNLPQDQIVFEADDTGNIVPIRQRSYDLDVNSNYHISSKVNSALTSGKLTTREFHHGRIIRVNRKGVGFFASDNDKSILLDDYQGKTVKIVVKNNNAVTQTAGDYEQASGSTTSAKIYNLYVKGGLSADETAKKIAEILEEIKNASASNPQISALSSSGVVYVDPNDAIPGNILKFGDTGNFKDDWYLQDNLLGGRLLSTELTLADFSSQISGILSSSFDNFLELGIISSFDRIEEDDDFLFDKNSVTFDMNLIDRTELTKLKQTKNNPPSSNEIDSLFSDRKMANDIKFAYLPPLIKVNDEDDIRVLKNTGTLRGVKAESFKKYQLADYPPWGENSQPLRYNELNNELEKYSSARFTMIKSSITNNVIGQMFEVATDGTIKKLDIIKAGEILSSENIGAQKNEVYFVGKVISDDRGTTCFINMFTIIFSNEEVFRDSALDE